jgi:5-methyltetrahydrofolate--homocysteine methyltransferase
MTIREQLNSIAEKHIIILDGAMGSVIQILNLDEKVYRGNLFTDHPVPLYGCNDLLCLTRPGAVSAIHDTYFEAGADIIETCSFNATSINLAEYKLGHLSYEISAAAARIARKSAQKFSTFEKPRFVAGSIGPTIKKASLGEVGWDELEASYYDNARGLLDGGADIFLVETVSDTINAKAALRAINRLLEERRIDVPVIISASVLDNGRLPSGQSLEAFFTSLKHLSPNNMPWAMGLNCSFNATNLLPHLQLLSQIAPCLTSAYPNAGLPNQFGRYEETPEVMSDNIAQFFKEGLVNIIGGCCGSTPAHIAAIADKAFSFTPRKIPNIQRYTAFSGLETFYIENNIVYLNKKENGNIINIKADDEQTVISLVNNALSNRYMAKTPFFINSRDINVLLSGIKCLQGHGFAGPIDLKNGEKEFLLKAKLIQSYGAAVVVTLTDEYEDNEKRKIEIAQRVYRLLHEIGYFADNFVFDPNTAVLSPEGNSICAWIRDNCPGALIAL